MSTIEMVKQVRDRSNVSLNECRLALDEAGGDVEKALELIKQKGLAKAVARAGRIAAEGRVHPYIHQNRIGVLLEVNCETDFTAKSTEFVELCDVVAMQIAAMNPQFVSPEEIPEGVLRAQNILFENQLLTEQKPRAAWPKIIPGKLTKWQTEVCLTEQESAQFPKKTIKQLVVEVSHTTGEKISIRRFVRFELGEGIAKVAKKDFAEEVMSMSDKS
jgi:elongation factor Ts